MTDGYYFISIWKVPYIFEKSPNEEVWLKILTFSNGELVLASTMIPSIVEEVWAFIFPIKKHIVRVKRRSFFIG